MESKKMIARLDEARVRRVREMATPSTLKGEENFRPGVKVEFIHGREMHTGTVVEAGLMTVRVRLDHQLTNEATGQVFKKGEVLAINRSGLKEKGLTKGEYWRSIGKTPWGAVPHALKKGKKRK